MKGKKGAGIFGDVMSLAKNPEIRGEFVKAMNENPNPDNLPASQLAKVGVSEKDLKDFQGFVGNLKSSGEIGGRRKTKKLRRKFDKCVKAVRKTIKARRGSTKKQAAYAICTVSILKEHGRK